MTVRWAAVGTGTISRSVVPDIQACEGSEVVLIQSRDPRKAADFADEFGIAASTGDYDEVLLDPSIDAIYLATPFAVHHAMASQALRAGKHVLVEKPMAMNAAEVADLFEIATRSGVFLMEAMWMKFAPAFLRFHEELAAGRVGDVRNLRASFGIPFPDPDGNSSKWDPARSGGALLDQGIYPITLAYSVFGEPLSVHVAGNVRADGLDLAEHFTLDYSDGRYAQCASSMTEFSELTASVGGTQGWMTLGAPFWATSQVEIRAGGMKEIFQEPEQVEFPREGNGYRPMIRAVTDGIERGLLQHPAHTSDDTIAVFRTIDAIRAGLVHP